MVVLRKFLSEYGRYLSSTSKHHLKVAIVGGSGGIGQLLGLLLKRSKYVTDLTIHDLLHYTEGVAADLSHINVRSVVRANNGPEGLQCSLKGMNVVVITAGYPRTKGIDSREALFEKNASIIRDLAEACAKFCPKAFIVIVTNPVNSCVPIAAEVFKKHGVFDPRRLFGFNMIDLVRAKTFVANLKRCSTKSVYVPCIGGHSTNTIVPLFSQCKPKFDICQEEVDYLTTRVKMAGTEVVKAKEEKGSSTLTTAYAISLLVEAFARSIKGEPNVITTSYVASDLTDARYFASPILMGENGVKEILPLPPLSKFEEDLLRKAIPELKSHIEKGERYILFNND